MKDNLGIAFHTMCAVYSKVKFMNRNGNLEEFVHWDFIVKKKYLDPKFVNKIDTVFPI